MAEFFRRYFVGLTVMSFRSLLTPTQLTPFADRIQYTAYVISYSLLSKQNLVDTCLNCFIYLFKPVGRFIKLRTKVRKNFVHSK